MAVNSTWPRTPREVLTVGMNVDPSVIIEFSDLRKIAQSCFPPWHACQLGAQGCFKHWGESQTSANIDTAQGIYLGSREMQASFGVHLPFKSGLNLRYWPPEMNPYGYICDDSDFLGCFY